MPDDIERALDLVTGSGEADWNVLEAEISDEETLGTIHALRDIAAIARAHQSTGCADRPAVPFQWGALHVRHFIAHGAHGDVYRAWDARLEREVALKLLRQEPDHPYETPYAVTEGRLLAKIRHPNVVAVYGADRIDGQAGLWMELVEGRTVRDIVTHDGPFPVTAALDVGVAVCAGLAAIHDAGLLHRDVKAQNVVREGNGRTILMDLSAGLDEHRLDAGLEGTPLYLAPEVLEGGQASVASDIYAVGVLLFFLVTGDYPVSAVSMEEIRRHHLEQRGERLAPRLDLPPRFAAAVDRALSRDPSERFTSVDEMRTHLEAALVIAPSVVSGRSLAVAAVLALVTLAGAGLAVRSGGGGAEPSGAGARAHALAPEPGRVVRLPHHRMGAPSSDGRFFPYADEQGNLHLWEVVTGRSQQLVESVSAVSGARASALSADGSRVAYAWRLPDGAFELMAVNTDRTWPVVLGSRQSAYEPVPVQWSRDGQSLLCWFRQKDGSADLVLVPTGGGNPQVLHSTDGTPMEASLSGDTRYVLLSARFDAPDPVEPLILDVSGGAPRSLLEPGQQGRMARWMPRDQHVLFLRASTAQRPALDGWLVKVADGAAVGDPTLAVRDVGPLSIAVTDGGLLLSISSKRTVDVYTAPIDLSGTTPPGPPTRLTASSLNDRAGPSWSPDGRFIAFFTNRPRASAGATPERMLTLQDVASQTARTIPLPLAFLGGYAPRWSPHGRHLVVWGADQQGEDRVGFYRVDLQNGEVAPFLLGRAIQPHQAQYSPDGRRFYYVDGPRGLVVRDLESGIETLIVAASRLDGRFAVAPRDTIAFVGRTGTGEGSHTTLYRLRPGEEPLALARAQWPEALLVQAWTPDGQSVLYSRHRGTQPYSLWLMSADGGAAVDLRFSLPPAPNPLSLSPDGRQIAYAELVIQMQLSIKSLTGANVIDR